MEKFASLLNKGFFRLARNASLESGHRVHVGAVLALHGKPVSVVCNVNKSHPDFTQSEKCGSIHAEVRAILAANTRVGGGVIYVYRETARVLPALARPCNQCYQFMKRNHIKKVYYTVGTWPFWKMEKIW